MRKSAILLGVVGVAFFVAVVVALVKRDAALAGVEAKSSRPARSVNAASVPGLRPRNSSQAGAERLTSEESLIYAGHVQESAVSDGDQDVGNIEPEASLSRSQLKLLELDAEAIRDAMAEEMTFVVEQCLVETNNAIAPSGGLALDFVVEPHLGEARIARVTFRAESMSQPAGLLDCVGGLAGIGPVALEIAEVFENRTFTLRLGANAAEVQADGSQKTVPPEVPKLP